MLKMNTYKWLLAAWMILLSCTLCPAQVYTSMQSTSKMMNANAPSYQFQSTSTYRSAVSSVYTPNVSAPFAAGSPARGIRTTYDPWSEWNEEDEENEAIGVAHEVPMGETPWGCLLLLIVAYLVCKRRYTVHHKTEQNIL